MKKLSVFIAIMAISGSVIWCSLQYNSGDKANDQKEGMAKVDSGSEDYYDNHNNPDKLVAYDLAADFVKEFLNEPTTAEFPGTKGKLKHIEHLGRKKYRINSWVDSKDTYGAMRRRSFSCIVKMDDSGVNIESFKIETYGHIPKNR